MSTFARKPDMVKLTYDERGWGSRPQIPLLDLALMQRIIEYYNDHGIRATVHASNEIRTREAIFAGVDALSHPMSIRGPITEEFARLMGAKKIPTVSTLTIGENYSRLVDSPEFLDQPLYQATLEARRDRTPQDRRKAETGGAALDLVDEDHDAHRARESSDGTRTRGHRSHRYRPIRGPCLAS